MQIAVDKIREVIGSGGKVIREIVEESGAKVDINDDGIIKIASANAAAIEKARELIARHRRRAGDRHGSTPARSSRSWTSAPS